MTTQPVLSSSVVMMKMMNNNLHHNDYIMREIYMRVIMVQNITGYSIQLVHVFQVIC